MSFFGFDASLPRGRSHNATAPGFGAAPDPFAGLSSRAQAFDDGGLDFEDTYDGLGDQLDEGNDAFNDDTFGGGPASGGADFDFSGQTAKMAQTLEGETGSQRARQPAPQPVPQPSAPVYAQKPARSGYERYAEPGYIPQLEANASLWGLAKATPPARPPQTSTPANARKMMSLEEVEAAMLAQSRSAGPAQSRQPVSQVPDLNTVLRQQDPRQQAPPGLGASPFNGHQFNQPPPPVPQHMQNHAGPSFGTPPQGFPQGFPPGGFPQPPPQGRLPGFQVGGVEQVRDRSPQRHTTQDVQRLPPGFPSQEPPPVPEQARAPLAALPQNRALQNPLGNPEQLLNLSEDKRAEYLAEDAKRAKRNHKIHMLSKDNGLMTPQDKNFITRIQLQQLVTATGGVSEDSTESMFAEDFYYQVLNQLRGASNPNIPPNNFAQTYLAQAGGRGNRRYQRGGDNHVRRMEQQVQRAVEAAKSRPKNKQLVIEGSLGKISFSNSKTPRPILTIKPQDSSDGRQQNPARPKVTETTAGRKAALQDIENIYTTLMRMEEHARQMPRPPTEESSGDEIQAHINWRQRIQELNQMLWAQLKVLEPIVPNSPTSHPFIAILSHAKGKKLLSRVFNQIDDQQRLTVLTMIVVHLDMLDVVRLAYPQPGEVTLPAPVHETVELFSNAVMPNLFIYVNEAPLGIVIGLVGLIIDRVNIQTVVRTKVGLGLLTMFVSRAVLVKQSGHADDADWAQWTDIYDRFFDMLEPQLPFLFSGPVNTGEDRYVWQFLAAMGVLASPEQQQRLVIGVKERVMETVVNAKSMPDEVAKPRLANVNLFMVSIGLDVELLS